MASDYPKMYQMHSYSRCRLLGGSFCLFDFKIAPSQPQENRLSFDRSRLNRMFCIPPDQHPSTEGLRLLREELHKRNISVMVLQHQCEQPGSSLSSKLLFWIFLFATVPKLWKNKPGSDFRRLSALQGVRVLTTCLVVFWHTLFCLSTMFLRDVNQLEQNFQQPLVFYLVFMGAFAVQIFFLMSTLLLTNQVLELRGRHGRISARHCWILVLNRIFRFLPTLAVAIAATRSGVYERTPHAIKLMNMCSENCGKNWWYSLLQITILLDFNQICNPIFWYLSVDTLYYLFTLFMLYSLQDFDFNALKVFGFLIFASIAGFAWYLYVNEYHFLYQPYPEPFKNLLESQEINVVYCPPLASWTSSLVGAALGYFYYHHKGDKNFTINSVATLLFWSGCAAVPTITLHLSTLTYKGPTAALMGAILKPLFVLPLGLGLVAMAFGMGGPLKTILESRFLLITGNVTYCTYVFHSVIVFAKGLFQEELIDYLNSHLIFWVVTDLVGSFALGTVTTVLLEYPGIELQRRILPQIGTSERKLKKN
ncbi:O-acyltransferase like protein-like isoform X2 [Euwallacea similis]|uniref:O-acyltransferase like protein-like isoform X2 n=1 Tax=Euwallacea similis TaxID=1736056 RepID=UPI00344DBC86